jgi:hypothetical protein
MGARDAMAWNGAWYTLRPPIPGHNDRGNGHGVYQAVAAYTKSQRVLLM